MRGRADLPPDLHRCWSAEARGSIVYHTEAIARAQAKPEAQLKAKAKAKANPDTYAQTQRGSPFLSHVHGQTPAVVRLLLSIANSNLYATTELEVVTWHMEMLCRRHIYGWYSSAQCIPVYPHIILPLIAWCVLPRCCCNVCTFARTG